MFFEITVKIHEKRSLLSPGAGAETPCDAGVSMSYKYTVYCDLEAPSAAAHSSHSSHSLNISILCVHTFKQTEIWK